MIIEEISFLGFALSEGVTASEFSENLYDVSKFCEEYKNAYVMYRDYDDNYGCIMQIFKTIHDASACLEKYENKYNGKSKSALRTERLDAALNRDLKQLK